MATKDTPVDVCIIGAGAGGGVVAKELSDKNVSVVVLEGGPRIPYSPLSMAEPDWESRLHQLNSENEAKTAVTFAPKSEEVRIVTVKGVGGSTLHYEGFCPRPHPADFKRFTQYGIGADWPVTYEELMPYFDKVESELGMSGALDNPFEPNRRPYPNPPIEFSCAVSTIKRGCETLGLHVSHAPLAILSRPTNARGACNFCGGCWLGCHVGAISNMAQTYIPRAERNGAAVMPGCRATRVLVNDHGFAKGVEFIDAAGLEQFISARVVVVAGNAIETARLLLLSATSSFPQGLANTSGLVGRNFLLHTHVMLTGLLPERVDAYKGPNINGMVQDYFDSDEKRGFLGGYLISLRNAELGPATFYDRFARGRLGKELSDYMTNWFGHSVSIEAFGETFSSKANRVELDPQKKDALGLALPQLFVSLGDNEKKMLTHMESTLRAILEASGGTSIKVLSPPMNIGTHLMGTCRMGEDPKTSVTNSYGQTHDIKNLFVADGSVFPSSTPTNPTLIIQALATRLSHYIARSLSDRTL